MSSTRSRASHRLGMAKSLNSAPRPLGEGKGEGRRTAFLLIAVALLWIPSLAHGQELRRILYGVSTSISHLPVWVGKDTGLFAKNGLNIEPVQIRCGAVSTMAIMSL